jgi:hypothetical protein
MGVRRAVEVEGAADGVHHAGAGIGGGDRGADRARPDGAGGGRGGGEPP